MFDPDGMFICGTTQVCWHPQFIRGPEYFRISAIVVLSAAQGDGGTLDIHIVMSNIHCKIKQKDQTSVKTRQDKTRSILSRRDI